MREDYEDYNADMSWILDTEEEEEEDCCPRCQNTGCNYCLMLEW